FVDQIIAEEGIFAPSVEEAERIRLRALRGAVAWHVRPGTPYATYAARQGFALSELDEPAGLDSVPLLPSMLLKRQGVSVVHPEARDVLWTTSSGTKGGVSQIPRDDITLRRFFAS